MSLSSGRRHRYRLCPAIAACRGIKYKRGEASTADFWTLFALLRFFQNRTRRAHFLKVEDNIK